MANKFGLIEASNADVVMSYTVKDRDINNLIEAGYVAKYTGNGETIELASGLTLAEDNFKIAGVVCGISRQKTKTGRFTQDVVIQGGVIACKYVGSGTLVAGSIAYLDSTGAITDSNTSGVIIGKAVRASNNDLGIAYIRIM